MLVVAVFRSESAPLNQERFRFIAEFYQEFLVGKVVENHPYPDFGLVLEHADLAPSHFDAVVRHLASIRAGGNGVGPDLHWTPTDRDLDIFDEGVDGPRLMSTASLATVRVMCMALPVNVNDVLILSNPVPSHHCAPSVG